MLKKFICILHEEWQNCVNSKRKIFKNEQINDCKNYNQCSAVTLPLVNSCDFKEILHLQGFGNSTLNTIHPCNQLAMGDCRSKNQAKQKGTYKFGIDDRLQ